MIMLDSKGSGGGGTSFDAAAPVADTAPAAASDEEIKVENIPF